MPAIAQAAIGHLHYQRRRFGAAHINRRQHMLVRIRHAYWSSCSLGIAGLGFFAFVPSRVEFSVLVGVCAAGCDAPVLTFGESTTVSAAFLTGALLLA